MKRTPLLFLLCLILLSLGLFHFEPSKAKNESSNNQQGRTSQRIDSSKSTAVNLDQFETEKILSAAVLNPPQDQNSDITVVASYHNDTSIPVRKMKPLPVVSKTEHEANENPKIPNKHQNSPDPVVQDRFAILPNVAIPNMPSPVLNFDGIPFPGVACNCAPPDTNGEVGATQYVQIANEGFQVFNKTNGASVLGPVGISTLWSGFGGPCESNGAGDPVVLYDQLANRWLISQFAGVGVITDECVAVSTTSDATGSYNRYAFHLGSNFFDYPKLAVWPDAYYMAMNVFTPSNPTYLGPQPFALDRAKMLAGLPATFITTGITGGPSEAPYLPADLDGLQLPPVGSPATFVQWPATGNYRVFHFHVDFANPFNSTFTLFASSAAAGFTFRNALIPQLSSTSGLDPLGDRLMFRAATRFFPDGHESLVSNYTVESGGVAAVRWFELRNPTVGPTTVFQQGTYQPDTTHRWMGSAAMDQLGNLAVGYSASSSAINPQIRYAGRLAGDPLNTLPQAEVTLFAGTGSQVNSGGRWGDYSAMTIDPVDDCTFWYTQEYYATTAEFNWRTRIGSFKFPGCGVRTLTVASVNPSSGVNITVSPNDNSGFGNGTTQFTRTYNNLKVVNLTAPATAGGNNFQKWQRNGADWATTQTTNVTMDANYTMTAVYVAPQRTLTVASSNPSSGASISISPSDNNGAGDGVTQFTRSYNNNTSVRLAAATTVGANDFQKWQRNGADWSTSLLTDVVMDANYTMTAVYAPGTGGNFAVYDPVLKAPKCGQPGNACDSGGLLTGRGNMSGGVEPNQPNTINNSCSDGSTGTFHVDESIDRIKVSTTDGSTLAPGKLVNFEVTYWAPFTDSDFLDLYYLPDTSTSNWIYMTTLQPQAAGLNVVTAVRLLGGNGNLQAVRAILRFGGSNALCSAGIFNDHDDLVFAAPAPPPTLMVESSNPNSGVSITVSPNDLNGQGNGVTQFTRIYNNNTTVNLTAPATVGGNNFLMWRRNGFEWSSSLSTSVDMVPETTTMTAVYITPQRTLTVASVNPSSGVNITVSPNDNGGLGNGTTQFTRSYNNGTGVNLTAPATAGGNTFQKWQRNGVDYATTQATTVTVDADHTMTAVYVTPIRTLTVASSNPASGVSITVSPNDNGGLGNGITPFTRNYNNNTTVNLTAPATAGGNTFQKWQRNGVDYATTQATNVTMDANYTMTAVYGTPVRTLTVASVNPSSGVSITVSPNDNGGLGNGTTQFTRNYNNNTNVNLTAPATAGGNNFQKWQRNGVDWATTATTTVTLDANYTMTAIYVTPQRTLTVASVNPNSGVSITVSPNDNSGSGNGITPFTRTYNNNTTVTLTAPLTAAGNNFQKWQRNGVDWATTAATTMTLDANLTMTAVYLTPQRTLTVASVKPGNGVSITVSPNDNGGLGNGTTQFTRNYNNNTTVNLTAPATAAGNNFQKWQRNGVDWATTPATTVTLDANYTMTAVYAGLAGFWMFDENANTITVDSSVSGNTGTLTGGAGWATGQNRSAVSLDGVDDYVQVGAQSSLVMTNSATFTAWIHPTGSGSQPVLGGIIINKEGEYEIARFSDGTIQWAFANANPGWNWINTGAVAPLNQWTHVAVVYESGTVRTYINGVLAHTHNGSGAIGDVDNTQNDFRVGGRQLTTHNFQGRIDEVRTYNRALSASEIPQLMGDSTAKGHWKFDENAGTTAADGSGNGNTGTLTAGAGWTTGQNSSAVSLDGVNDYVQVGAQSSLVMTNTASFTAWIHPTGSGSQPVLGGIIINKEGEYEIARFSDGTIQWAFANTNPGWNWINTGGVAPLNQWTHVAVVYESGAVRTYINGVLTHTHNGSGAIGDVDNTQNDFRIGGRQLTSHNFQGRIDEVRTYNRALSASEIIQVVGDSTGELKGHWKFDENAGTTAADSSDGGNNTGTLTAGAGWATGKNNSAVSLDGVDDYVQVGAQSSLVMTNSATFTAWIHPTGSGSQPVLGGIIINKEGEYGIVRFSDGTIQWAFANANPGWNWINTGVVAPLNQWTHVAVVYDNGVVKTYINGILAHTHIGSGAIGDVDNTRNDFRIGGRQLTTHNFQGRIDEVRIYNRTLSASEIGALMGN
jgi:predicted lipoprotein with Yx(FWY)xxD motif